MIIDEPSECESNEISFMRAPYVSLMPARLRETEVRLIAVRSAIHTGIFFSWFRTKHEIHGTRERDAAACVMEREAPAGDSSIVQARLYFFCFAYSS
jgi:hypothetical protein